MPLIYQERIFDTGENPEVYIYSARRMPRNGEKRAKTKVTSDVQALLNKNNAIKQARRLLNANFCSNDNHYIFTFAENPESDDEAFREYQNLSRRLKRLAKKKGVELKKLATIEKTKKNGIFHFHIIMNIDLSAEETNKVWGKGIVPRSPLYIFDDGLGGLAQYIQKNPIQGKRWMASKNLVIPEPEIVNGRISKRKIEELAKNTDRLNEYSKLYAERGWRAVNVVHKLDVIGRHYFEIIFKKEKR